MSALHNEELEQHLLGTLLASDKVYDHVSWIRPEYFYNSAHARIYEHISRAAEQGKSTSPQLLAKHLENDPDFAHVGGGQFLRDLADSIVTTTAAPGYAEEIHRLHVSRMLQSLAKDVEAIATDDSDTEAKINAIESIAFNLRDERSAGQIQNSEAGVTEALKAMEQARKGFSGVRTGIGPVDSILNGLKPSALYILAGRPAMGKTAAGLTVAANAAQAGKKVLFFSQEMANYMLQQRLIARFSGVSVDAQNTAHTDEDMQPILKGADQARALTSLHVDESPSQRVTDILSKSRRFARKYKGLDLIVVDYLGLMQADDHRANKVHQIEQITTGLKNVAKRLNVPVLLLCQLSRAVENRDVKRPILSDLRDSGSIEQDADAVMFIHRPEYYLQTSRPEKTAQQKPAAYNDQLSEWQRTLDSVKGKAEIIIAKNRQGKTGTANVLFSGERQLFYV